MTSLKNRRWTVAAMVIAAVVGGLTVVRGAVDTFFPTTLTRPTVYWFGPYAISPVDTARFNYTNLGVDPVRIEWAFTTATTGEVVCGNIGNPVVVEAGKGAIWDYSQTIDPRTGEEVIHCNEGAAHELEPGEKYFDATNRHNLVSWLFIEHASARGEKLAVDLPTVELFNSMVMADGQRSMTFGRTLAVLHANPSAPTNFKAPK